MFRTDSKVEKGRVAAHEGAETGVAKVHTLIDKVAEGAEVGQEKAAAAGAVAAAKAADVRKQAEQARKDAEKDARKGLKRAKKKSKKGRKNAVKDAHDLKATVVDDVLPKVLATAAGLAATGSEASRKLADEAGNRGPEAFAALKDDHDTKAAIAALKGERPRKKRRALKMLVLAGIAGAVAAYIAKKQQGPKKDPWAVPAGDPYKAPETGRASSVGGAAPLTTAAGAGTADTALGDTDTTDVAMTRHEDGVADDTVTADSRPADKGVVTDEAVGETRPLTNEEVEQLASEDPTEATVGAPEETALTDDAGRGDEARGDDAWSSARDWADESSIPGEGEQRRN